MGEPLLPPHGGFRNLRSFQVAQAIYDGTVQFCDRHIEKRSRTHDQMVQAARSGVQNIAEGSLASATSRKTELKLTGVARASLGELLLDYEDFLRQRGMRRWDKDSPEAMRVRKQYLGSDRSDQSDKSDRSDKSDKSDQSDSPFDFRRLPAGEAANIMICLINQASYLLWRQMQALERQFLQEGGFTERLHRERSRAREMAVAPDGPSPAPTCPLCGRRMRSCIAKSGPNAGQPFWGCTGFPDCRGTRRGEQDPPRNTR